MISTTHRFHRRSDIQRLHRTGRTIRGQHFSLRFMPGAKQHYRAAVVVSRKVSKSAVVRNRIRRRIYEQLRLQAGDMKTAADMAFIVYDESLATMPADKLATATGSLLKKAKLL